jgi:hypothetical protein
MDVQTGTFTQAELCQVTGLNNVTVDTWLIRGILQTTKVGGRTLRGRRLFSVLAIFEAAVVGELVNRLAMAPSEAAKVARCAAADWNTADDWKPRVITAIERSAKLTNVFLIIVRTEDGWRTVPVYGDRNGPPVFEPRSKYEGWFATALGILPASDLLSSIYVKCRKIATEGKDSGDDQP